MAGIFATDQAISTEIEAIATALRDDGFRFERATAMRALLEHGGLTDWKGFAGSWNRLGLDKYMADGGHYRRRRYGTFSLRTDAITRKRHQPHYQSRDYNLLNGGIERWFRPIEDSIGAHPALQAILRFTGALAFDLTPPAEQPEAWHAEVHQFRIEARPDAAGQPTPEGMHRDGVDWVLVLMVSRENVQSGVTSIHDSQRQLIGSFTLADPCDSALVDDHRVYHGVTAVEPLDPSKPAYRDVLVVTLRHE